MSKDNYEDIINLPHHTSLKHPRMTREARAAQFAPFAALTGYDDAIRETGRLTDKKIDLSNEEKLRINDKLQIINDNIKSHPKVTITYFEYDKKKEGGQYLTYIGNIKKIDMVDLTITLTDKTKINISEIIDITIT